MFARVGIVIHILLCMYAVESGWTGGLCDEGGEEDGEGKINRNKLTTNKER